MAKVSSALRERMLAQKKSMEGGGMLIRNKGFNRMKLRVLPPREGELPGCENISFFSKPLNKGTTSPASWGVACPIVDHLDKLYREGSKEDKDAAKEFVKRQVEYWIPVIDRSNEGTPQNPRLRILQGKQSVYQPIVDRMLDEDDGDDVTDPQEGRDILVKRKGTGLDTEWSVDFLDKCPISEDEEMANAIVEAAAHFDVRSRFFVPKLDVMQEMYKGLTGESIPKSYMDPLKKLIARLEAGFVDPEAEVGEEEAEGGEAAEATEEAVETTEAEGEAVADEGGEEAADDGDLTGQTVQFENEGETVQGTVSGPDTDEDGNWLVVEDGGNPDEPWSIPADSLTIVEVEEEPEEAPPPPPAKKKVVAAKPAPATKPAATPKPAATKTSIPATKPAAAPKPAPAAKPAAKPAPSSMPRKPGAAAAPKASAGIKAGLKSKLGGKK